MSRAVRKSVRKVEISLSNVLSALGDDTRLHIVRELADRGEVPCGQFNLDLPKSTMTHHFNVLMSAGIITRRRDGTAQLNRLRRDELDRSFPGLLDAILAKRKSRAIKQASSGGDLMPNRKTVSS